MWGRFEMVGAARQVLGRAQEVVSWTEKIGIAAALGCFSTGIIIGVFSQSVWWYFDPPRERILLPKIEDDNRELARQISKLKNDAANQARILTQVRHDLIEKNREIDIQKTRNIIEIKSLNDELNLAKSRMTRPSEQQVIAEVGNINSRKRWGDLRRAEEIYIGQKVIIFNGNIVLSAEETANSNGIEILTGNDRCKFVSESRSGIKIEEVLKVGTSVTVPLAGTRYVVELISKEDGKCKFSYNFVSR